MLSGIGPAEELRAQNIPVVLDRQAVGQNLRDHLQVRLIYRCTKPITTNDALRSIFGRAGMAMEWLLHRTGPLATGINQGGLFTRVLPESQTPDIQFHVATLSADMAGGKVHDFSGFTLSVCQLRPESTGSIRLASADPFAAPKIHANYLATTADRRCTTAAIAFARKLAATPPLSDYVAAEVLPGPDCATDAELLSFRPAARCHDLSSGRHLPNGRRRRGGGRSPPAAPRHRRLVGGGLLDHADAAPPAIPTFPPS